MCESNRVALVTGGASGFGAGIARKLADKHIRVLVADINKALGEQIANEITKAGGQAVFVTLDVTDPVSWDKAIEYAESVYGRLNFVINNAGGTYNSRPVLETTDSDFDKCISLNLRSIFYSIHASIPALRRAAKAHPIPQPAVMINVASTGGVKGRPGLTWYSASKAAAISASQSLALEFAGEGIRVNCICPVLGNTPLRDAFIGQASAQDYAKTIPLGRFAEPSDIGDAVAFLCSEEASFITGVVLPVDGGRLAL